ncbi:MAG: cell division protein FtsA [Bacteroidaceae bacterium]|nr:cell division protein FtsA [Bacteroidaceae bacterium]MBQ3958822.1 cell division protein FtsA [Bacteroidaceae bacterium]
MVVEKDIIVAVELGSTAIRAIAGKREPDGSMLVLAVAQEESANAIRKGVVDNIDRTTQAIRRVVDQINEKLGVFVNSVYVGLGGQSLHAVSNKVSRQFGEKIQIAHSMVDEMKDTNLGVMYPDAEILDVVPQEFRIGNRLVADPVGMQSEQLEAHFLNVISRKSLSENIEKCVQGAGLEMAELLISPICLSDALLSASEKRSGCALVDMGADTTSIAVYDGGMLRHLIVIPLGGSNVTADIMSKSIEQEEAETLKLKYGTAYRVETEDQSDEDIALSHSRNIKESVLQEIVEARYEEIIDNIWEQIRGKSQLLSGVVFTGGCARVRNLTEAFTQFTHCGPLSLRVAKGLPVGISLSSGVRPDVEQLDTLMALLLQGKCSCVTEKPEEKVVQDEINFGDETPEQPVATENEAEQNTPETPETEKTPKKPREGLGKKVMKWWEKINDAFSEPED